MAWGQITMDGTETLYALDGQHRLKSIQLALRVRPELAREQIPVIFIPFRSPRRSQLLFSDLNRFAKSPSKSISLLFSHRDPVVTLAKTLMERVPFLTGRVEVETTSLSKHTPNVMTLSSLYEMTRALTNGRSLKDPLDPAEVDRQVAIWDGLVGRVEPWHKVVAKEEHPAFLRKEYLAMHGVCHQAIAIAVAPLLGDTTDFDAPLRPLAEVDWRIANPEWQGIAVQGRHISNTSTTIRNLAGLLALKIGGTVEPSVARSLVAAIEARGEHPAPSLVELAKIQA
jgi:DNA sulfur modification protein DndB